MSRQKASPTPGGFLEKCTEYADLRPRFDELQNGQLFPGPKRP
jgi:hypothetical protein